ncbi:MAG TPA: B-box zinc finger protein [Candidatus Hydrogenedentes bacterium]|nr:B-box zinc finger protein [Candidatus Hydrogenedentota bacterium]HOL76937.1 B-box zinc finger protein [Candidatus Hydrogenedentota bacterium]HPO87307.1 B-box zinc finger protein [Candidatus Hydrogenedentota bacterium]
MFLETLRCGKCKAPLPEGMLNSSDIETCPSCGGPVAVWVFPALFGRPEPLPESTALPEESTCFFHPTNRAEVVCDTCGRFLCPVCDLEFRGAHFCSVCLDKTVSQKKTPELENRFFHYDELALVLAIVSLFIPCLVVFTVPASLYYVIKHWRTPLSAVPRGRWRWYLSMVFSFLAVFLVVMWIVTVIDNVSFYY